MTDPPIHLMLLDRRRLRRECLATLLHREASLDIIATHSGKTGLSEAVQAADPDVVVVVCDVEDEEALRLVRRLRRCQPQVKIIVHGVEREGDMALRFLEAGANGFSQRSASTLQLKKTLRAVQRDELRCCDRLAYCVCVRVAELSSLKQRMEVRDHHVLSQRELEILRWVAQGLENQEIAQRLIISPHTVKNHMHNILSKLGVRRRIDAVRLAGERGWLRESIA